MGAGEPKKPTTMRATTDQYLRRQRSVAASTTISTTKDIHRYSESSASVNSSHGYSMYRSRSTTHAFWHRQAQGSSFMEKPTPKWKLLLRKIRAETRKKMYSCCSSPAPNFHYDSLSYAMNFDDGDGCCGIASSRRPLEIYSRTNSRTQLRPSVALIPV